MLLAPYPHLTGSLVPTPSGVGGAHHTLRVMRQLVDAGKTDVDIIGCATSCAWNAPEMDAFSECAAIFDFVRQTIRYQRDPHGVETLCEPRITLLRQIGDCDDQTTLVCALFEAAGYPTRFVMAGYRQPGVFEHVYAQVLVNGEWLSADATEQQPLGWNPPGAVCLYVERN